MGLLDRPRRHLHRHRRPRPGRPDPRRQAALREPRRLPRRRRRRHPPPDGSEDRASRSRPSGSPAVKMGTTVATNALLERKGDRVLLLDHPRLPRRAADRLPGAAGHLRPADRQAGDALRARRRGRPSACAPTARWRPRPTLSPSRADLEAAWTPASARSPSSSCTPGPTPSTSGRWPPSPARMGFPQVSASHEVSPLIKLVGRGDTTVVDAYLSPVLRRYVDEVAAELSSPATQARRRRPARRAQPRRRA